MKIFDEEGNFLGEFFENRIEEAKESVSDSFQISWILGILCFCWQPIWTLVILAVFLILKGIWKLFLLCLRIMWWSIRLPFALIIWKECPSW